jgi:hypothetical protein
VNAAALIDLITGLGRSVPSLPNAACRQHVTVFDSTAPDDIARAIEICDGCADLQPCRRWADSLPPRSFDGVVAGVYRTHSTKRKRKETMTTKEIEPMRLPDELVTITPIPDGLEFAYQQSPGGVDLISVLINDKRVGSVRVLLTTDGARYVAAHLNAMVEDLDNLREHWNNREDRDD